MKKLIYIFITLMMLAALAVPASARTIAQQMDYKAVVEKDGSCEVTITAEMNIDETVTDPVFAVPTAAEDVKLNGRDVDIIEAGKKYQVSLKEITGGVAGKYSVTVTYRLKNPVKAQEEDKLMLTLPLLSDFEYPVEVLKVTVQLPAEVEHTPSIISAYHQNYTDKILKTKVTGNTVTVESLQQLFDAETLTMNLEVGASMFPKTAAKVRMLGMMDIAVVVALVMACAYYMLTMRPAIPKKKRQAALSDDEKRSSPPDGMIAGEVAPWLVGGKMDLSLLVVSWAQLGYLRIEVKDDGRVLLHKRMEMGNERSGFEMRCYKNLFGRRHTLDCGSGHYARMVHMVRKKGSRRKDVYRKKSGNPIIFSGLCALAALFSGISLAGAAVANSGFLRFLLVAAVTIGSFVIQSGTRGLVLRRKLGLLLAVGCAACWIVIGASAGRWLVTVLMVLLQLLAGVLMDFGGMRTELGQQALEDILRMRKFMRTADKNELQRLLKGNPGYFYEMAPYALELGVDRRFAARFERLRIGQCSYLTSGSEQMTASQWAALLRKTVDAMDAKARKTLPWQR